MSTAPTAVLALVGNPNTGKTTLFNALSGMRQRVGNYPGVTVETKKGQFTPRRREPSTSSTCPAPTAWPPAAPTRWSPSTSSSASRPGEAAARRRRRHRRCLQPRPQPLPDDAGPGTRRAGRRRPEHDRRGRERRALQIDVATARRNSSACRSCRSRRTRAAASTAQGRRSPQAADAAAPRRGRPPFPEAFEREVAAPARDAGRRTCRRSWSAGCCSTSAATPSSGSPSGTATGIGRRSCRPPGSGWRRPAAPSPAVEARTRYALDSRTATAGCVDRPAAAPGHLDRPPRPRADAQRLGHAVFLVLMFLVFQSIFAGAKPLMDADRRRQGLARAICVGQRCRRGRCAACSPTASSRASAACSCSCRRS